MQGDVDSASGLDGENKITKQQIWRKSWEEKSRRCSGVKPEKSEDLDQLESWHKKLSATGFRVGILHLTSNLVHSKTPNKLPSFPIVCLRCDQSFG